MSQKLTRVIARNVPSSLKIDNFTLIPSPFFTSQGPSLNSYLGKRNEGEL